ncbi:response regulator [Geobacter sp. SVR]|uniref:response regulator n=1 Tax=Geobacter sp. SVR TaxID=2495594 RepID=UPI00143EFD29|nr:response regulator [Geobacter sp. SVR]BCS52683.1 hypothetical protein GSVR_09910 [Geobacter sp. SVR]GCF86822.1 hypothetical protein GSbR_34220 [Geobacter sp. SVR]
MTTDTTNRQTVLIVDDTPEDIRVLMETLRHEYSIIVVTGGERALQLAHAEPVPDIILLDVTMSGLDGYEICTWLKSFEKTNPIPVLFINAKSREDDECTGLELGAANYIRKPFYPVVLKARIRNLLNQRGHLDGKRNQRITAVLGNKLLPCHHEPTLSTGRNLHQGK